MTPTDKPMTVDALIDLLRTCTNCYISEAANVALRAAIEQYGREREALGARWNITDEMVSRFLRWRLPDDFAPDGGILFKRVYNEASLSGPKNHEPTGTNLFSGEQARKMLEHVLEGEPKISVDLGWRKECDDIDAVLKHIGLDLEQCRTDGGFLNVPRIKTLLAEREAAGRGSGEPVADCLAEKWQCDLGNGEFDHDWEVVHDWEGDPGVIGGTKDICYLRCRACGAEDYDVDPSDYAPEPDDWIDER